MEHEGPGGYGVQRHHVPQTASPEARRRLGGWATAGALGQRASAHQLQLLLPHMTGTLMRR